MLRNQKHMISFNLKVCMNNLIKLSIELNIFILNSTLKCSHIQKHQLLKMHTLENKRKFFQENSHSMSDEYCVTYYNVLSNYWITNRKFYYTRILWFQIVYQVAELSLFNLSYAWASILFYYQRVTSLFDFWLLALMETLDKISIFLLKYNLWKRKKNVKSKPSKWVNNFIQ